MDRYIKKNVYYQDISQVFVSKRLEIQYIVIFHKKAAFSFQWYFTLN
jgi:hypothetical protein